MSRARIYPVISAENILELQASDVRRFWGTTIPASGLRDCEVRLAKEAAARAGFDLVTITANIHPTTTRGTRRDKPHLTVKFPSTRYNQQTEQTVHINVHVWDPRSGNWRQCPSSRRPDNFPYHYVFQDGNICSTVPYRGPWRKVKLTSRSKGGGRRQKSDGGRRQKSDGGRRSDGERKRRNGGGKRSDADKRRDRGGRND